MPQKSSLGLWSCDPPLSSYLTAFTRGGQMCWGVMENTCSQYLFLFLLSLSTSLPVEASRQRLRWAKVSPSEDYFTGPNDNDMSGFGDECYNLAIARNELDVSRLSHICRGAGDAHCWVGLRKRGNDWKWLGSDTITSLPVSDRTGQAGCGTIQGNKLHAYNCKTPFKALCQYDNLVLVKEEKTWEEALQHCRARGLQWDLLSFHDEDELSFTQEELVWTQTEEVWTAQRWLAGRWLWMDRTAGGDISLPAECPANGNHCGTLSESGQHARNCMEKRRFFCVRSRRLWSWQPQQMT